MKKSYTENTNFAAMTDEELYEANKVALAIFYEVKKRAAERNARLNGKG